MKCFKISLLLFFICALADNLLIINELSSIIAAHNRDIVLPSFLLGLANRLRTISSLTVLAQRMVIHLVVFWMIVLYQIV